MIRTLQAGSIEYKSLKAVASMLEALSTYGRTYTVRDTYFDFGQDWRWTTIICEGTQILSPRQWEMVISADTPQKLAKAVEDIMNDKYFSDK